MKFQEMANDSIIRIAELQRDEASGAISRYMTSKGITGKSEVYCVRGNGGVSIHHQCAGVSIYHQCGEFICFIGDVEGEHNHFNYQMLKVMPDRHEVNLSFKFKSFDGLTVGEPK